MIETETGDITGVEAVIDKDFGSSLLATMIGADLFVISTAVEQVALNFNTTGKVGGQDDACRSRQYTAEGRFARIHASKINAIVQFLEKGGGRRSLQS